MLTQVELGGIPVFKKYHNIRLAQYFIVWIAIIQYSVA